MVGITKRDCFRSGGWPEYEDWGGEDDLFYYKVGRTVGAVVRERYPGLVHHAHEHDPMNHRAGPEREARHATEKVEFDRRT